MLFAKKQKTYRLKNQFTDYSANWSAAGLYEADRVVSALS
jgi:hypothetical protein